MIKPIVYERVSKISLGDVTMLFKLQGRDYAGNIFSSRFKAASESSLRAWFTENGIMPERISAFPLDFRSLLQAAFQAAMADSVMAHFEIRICFNSSRAGENGHIRSHPLDNFF